MHIWHDRVDAPRRPSRVSPGEVAEITVGTWPIESGQSVQVLWEVLTGVGSRTGGTVAARWQRNDAGNSYWTAQLGPFVDGDRVTYTVAGASSDGAVQTPAAAFRVSPALHVAWLWHQHQPLYRDPGVSGMAGSYRYPWVRLHAIRDYYCMAALAAAHDVHVTFNLTPVLLRQIDDYVLHGATDAALELTRQPAESLTRPQVEDMLSTFFDADWHNQILVHPRYAQLLARRTAGAPFSRQDLRDVQMWFNLAWFGHEFRTAAVRLITGETVDVARFVRQQHGFSHADVMSMLDAQYTVLRAIVPLHRALQDSGRIEVSTTPAFHPILPLLIDTDQAYVDRAGASRPPRYAYVEDAVTQIVLAHDDYVARFGRTPAGVWPAEGAVSPGAVELVGRGGFRWLATDEGVLARSGRWGYQTSDPAVRCQPYRTLTGGEPVAAFFRDTDLSDGIGFRYRQYGDPHAAVHDFVRAVETRILERLPADGDYVLTIVLDGENAWGGYPDDGRPFLHALYEHLSSDARLKTVTFSEYLSGNPMRGIAPHPVTELLQVHDLATGSWIDEPGSAPGVDLGTWIGEPEENAAWTVLGEARSVVARMTEGTPGLDQARASLLAAEGSDWFWWFGSDQESSNDASFDELFRAHVRGAYKAIGAVAPTEVDDPIVPHAVVWTFVHPVARIAHRDRLTIRTNCPGRLTFRIGAGEEQEMCLAAVGGVMAGPRRFQATLGPFAPEVASLTFRFHCEHPGCAHDAPCCLGLPQAVQVGRSRVAVASDRAGADTRGSV
jgi:alpha-amylase/alpha-mannosidase (GH57 family)